MKSNTLRSIIVFVALAVAFQLGARPVLGDPGDRLSLFIGDVGDNTVKRFDAATGAFLGVFIESGSAGLDGPMGLIFRSGKLVVVNQNFGGDNGEVLRFDARTGRFLDKLVRSNDPDAPFAPRGIVRGSNGEGNVLYVADIGTAGGDCRNEGRIARFHGSTGKFLGDLDRHRFTPELHPRGVVFGPDGLLYVSAIGCPIPDDPRFDPIAGFVLRFDPRTLSFLDVFASTERIPDLHRPEGLVFDRDGNLWVTSFRASPDDTDKILKLDGRTGALLDALELAPPVSQGGQRAFAQAILFGPDGHLFIPITGGNPVTGGQVRRCDVKTKVCAVIVPAATAGGALLAPFYLAFDETGPSTLAFEDD